MKNTIKVFEAMRSIAIIALVAVIGFSMAGCNNDPSPETATYTGTAGDKTYTLKIMATAPRFTAINGDSYELTVTYSDGSKKKSTGTIKVSGSIFTLTASTGTGTLTVTVNTTGGITAMSGTINFDGGGSERAPDNITPGGDTIELKISETAPPLPAGAPAITDFGYYWTGSAAKPLSDLFTGSPKVQITGGKLTIELGTPKNTALAPIFNPIPTGITVTPIDAKILPVMAFCNSTGTYDLQMQVPEAGDHDLTILVYVDKDVRINGTGTIEVGHTEVYNNVSLKKGWNYLSAVESGTTSTNTASQTKPSGATWKVKARS